MQTPCWVLKATTERRRGTVGRGRWALVSAASAPTVGNPPKCAGSNREGLGRKEASSSFKHSIVYHNSSQDSQKHGRGILHSFLQRQAQEKLLLHGDHSDMFGWRSIGGKAKIKHYPTMGHHHRLTPTLSWDGQNF